LSVKAQTHLAMLTAGLMLAHLWAAKAVRSAVFLSAWDANSLPAMVFVTAVAVVAAVPVYSRLLARFGPRLVVPIGLAVSAGAHLVEWHLSPTSPWVAVVVYLHIAGLGALLLSGFWSLASELFDTQTAKSGFGRIAAAGTIGGLLGGIAIERLSAERPDAALLLLALFHCASAVGAYWLGRRTGLGSRPRSADEEPRSVFDFRVLHGSPHLKTIALLVTLSTASAFVIEYLFQAGAQAAYPHRPDLQQFLARFYIVVGVATSLVQFLAGPSVRRIGLGRTISSLSVGLGSTTALTLVFQAFPMVVFVRGIESTLRASLFRSGYELLFVPMDPAEKRRTKTFLDVACDRAGDAIGALLVQFVLIAAPLLSLTAFLSPALLAVVVMMAAAGLWVGRRLDRLYLGVVERRLAKEGEQTPVIVPSEVGWTVIGLTAPHGAAPSPLSTGVFPAVLPGRDDDRRLTMLAELRSGDKTRVRTGLANLDAPDRMQLAQVMSLLAWDDVAVGARSVLERHASKHVGMLIDALVDQSTDFAVRRRLPRVLATVGSPRAIEGLLWSLEDERFEVRYQSARAIERLLRHFPALLVSKAHVLRAVDRELSVSASVWNGYRLIDRAESDEEDVSEEGAGAGQGAEAQRNLEHVFTLLATIFPREAVFAAHRGLTSKDPHLRGLAVEYLDSALEPSLRAKLWALV
jgi:ATP:ADP antiporter, AAA family